MSYILIPSLKQNLKARTISNKTNYYKKLYKLYYDIIILS